MQWSYAKIRQSTQVIIFEEEIFPPEIINFWWKLKSSSQHLVWIKCKINLKCTYVSVSLLSLIELWVRQFECFIYYILFLQCIYTWVGLKLHLNKFWCFKYIDVHIHCKIKCSSHTDVNLSIRFRDMTSDWSDF